MGVVHHATYLVYFEAARVEALRQIGVCYADLVAGGLHAAVVEATVRYRQPARFDDLLVVRVAAADVGRARFTFAYEVVREDDDRSLLATGQTVHACVEAATLRPVRLPQSVRDALERLREAP